MTEHQPNEPGPNEDKPNEDAAWQDLVSRLNEDPALRFAGLDEDPAAQENLGGPRDYTAPDGQDAEPFIPEDPAPLHSFQPALVLAWAGIIAAPVALVVAAMFFTPIPVVVLLIAIAVFIGCAGYLIYRLPQGRDESDDGARL